MKQYTIGSLEISLVDTAPLGWRLTNNIAILPALLYNQWDGHELTIGWLVWGVKFWWPKNWMKK